MNVVDNTFDFKVRDRLVKECRERNWKLLHSCTEDPRVMIDMITYCSQGNEEEAVLNLKASKEFMDRLRNTGRTFDLWSCKLAEDIMFLFWKKSFIELKVAVHKNEILPRDSCHEIMMREYGHLLHEENFADSDAFIAGVTQSMNLIEAATKILDNTFKDLMKNEEQN